MLQARDLLEQQIRRIRGGNASTWFHNWNDVGDLYNMLQTTREWDDRYQKVKDLIQN